MSSRGCEILIVGAGITGLTIAHELLRRGVEDILIIEKENKPGVHASGRNSGVLHAGVYYAPGTLKAKFCVQGNRLMKEFCRRKGLTLRENGKVIVVKDESELEGLFELKRRAEQSGARVQVVDSMELNDIEPYAATYEKALFSPDTAVINPKEVVRAIAEELEGSRKVRILYGAAFSRLKDDHTALTRGTEFAQKRAIHFKKFINAAGAYADRVARPFGVGKGYKVLPFKGTYKVLIKGRSFLVRGNVYPVPDLRNPFLGVHFTRGIDDRVYIGPTAIPAFGRENYGVFDGLSLEAISILYRDGILLFKDDGFRRNAAREIKKYSKRFFFEEAKRLLKGGLKLEDLEDTDKVGIRPQLVDWSEKKLVMDFLVIKDGDSLHVLNAISPAFTSSMAFAGYIADLFLGDKEVRAMNS
jgi:L-2-hydroxyglutarate oxidase